MPGASITASQSCTKPSSDLRCSGYGTFISMASAAVPHRSPTSTSRSRSRRVGDDRCAGTFCGRSRAPLLLQSAARKRRLSEWWRGFAIAVFGRDSGSWLTVWCGCWSWSWTGPLAFVYALGMPYFPCHSVHARMLYHESGNRSQGREFVVLV